MATPAPAYLVDMDVDFNDDPTPCIFFSAINHYVTWKSLADPDKAVFVEVIDTEFGGDPANVAAIESLQAVSIPGTTNSFGQSYEFLIRFNDTAPEPVVVTSTSVYHSKTLPATAGRQNIALDPDVIGTSATGLVAGTYTVTIAVDGGVPIIVSVTDVEAATYDALVTAINTDLIGATATLVAGAITIVSDTVGASSSIAISADALFIALAGFVSISSAVGGTDATAGAWLRTFDGSPA
jgi:hypothetical protein